MSRTQVKLIGLALLLEAVVLIHTVVCHNVVIDETQHVIAGLAYLRRGTTDFYPVNPPLARACATLPLLVMDLKLPSGKETNPRIKLIEWGRSFQQSNADAFPCAVVCARLSQVVLFFLGAWLVTRSATSLFGRSAGWIALCLWLASPNLLAWSTTVTCDLAATVAALGMVMTWRWYLLQPTNRRAIVTACVAGIGLATKFTLLVMLAVLIPLAIADRRCRISHGAIGIGVVLLVVNAVYLFHGTGQELGSYTFLSRALTGSEFGRPANRFRGTVLEHLPVPLPSDFVAGMDLQKSHSDYGVYNYLCGEWKQHGGWWYYYLVAAMVKVPLGTWLLACIALMVFLLRGRFRGAALDEACLLLPPAALLLLVSAQTGLNGYFRYLLPCFPFVMVSISRIGRLFDEGTLGRWQRALGMATIVLCLGWNAIDVFRHHPHYLSYFNGIGGGPAGGSRWLAGSDIDCGQDLYFLRDWVESHPEARPLHLAYFGGIHPRLLGLDLPKIAWEQGPTPGWFAVSVNGLVGMPLPNLEDPEKPPYPPGTLSYFQEITPIARAGYSIYIYHLSLEEANRVRGRVARPARATP